MEIYQKYFPIDYKNIRKYRTINDENTKKFLKSFEISSENKNTLLYQFFYNKYYYDY